jgi:hypothetical protein
MNTAARAQSVTEAQQSLLPAFLHQIAMRARFGLVATAAVLAILSACGSRPSAEEQHRQANTPAGKAGQVAHKIAVEAGKASRAMGRQLDKAARDAHAGWKEDARKGQDKKK